MEEELIFQAKKNDQKAFQVLFDLNWEYLYNYQLKRIGNSQIAEEISIQTFTKAFDRLDSFDPKFTFKTWLITISKNLHLDQIRKEKSLKKIQSDHINDSNTHMIIDNMPSPEEGMIINQNLDELLNTIKSLKKEYRKILQLRFFEDYSYKEISLELNQPLNTVKVKILRAKRLLAEKLNKK
jgi:RNA polymerase sigma-70 factor (ECF subfamily)|tara:strand:- start:164 stop:709 length:546 start_codon:yes stop_codon:yes gene_type:complete